MFLKNSLHADVFLWRNVGGGEEDGLDLVGDFLDVLERTARGHLFHQFVAVEPLAAGCLLKEGIGLHQPGAVHDIALESHGVIGLDPGGTAGYYRYSSGGGDGRYGGVAHGDIVARIGGVLPVGKTPTRLGQLRGVLAGLAFHESHDLLAEFKALFCIVGHAQFDQHVGPAHDTEADAAVLTGLRRDCLQRIAVLIDDIVQEMHPGPNRGAESVPVYGA